MPRKKKMQPNIHFYPFLSTKYLLNIGKINYCKSYYAFSEYFTPKHPYFVYFLSHNYLTLVFYLSHIGALDSLCIKYLLN